MPTYDYKCSACGYEWELYQSMKDNPVKSCPKCKKRKAKRLLGLGAGIIFKGTGFYETDYKNKAESSKKKDSKETNNSDTVKSPDKKSTDKSTKKDTGKSTGTKKEKAKAS